MKQTTKRCLAVFMALLMLFSSIAVMSSALGIGQTVKVSGSKAYVRWENIKYNDRQDCKTLLRH